MRDATEIGDDFYGSDDQQCQQRQAATERGNSHSWIKVLSKLLEVCQCSAEVNVGVLTVKQDAEYRLCCTCIVDNLATNTTQSHQQLTSAIKLSVTNHFILVTVNSKTPQ